MLVPCYLATLLPTLLLCYLPCYLASQVLPNDVLNWQGEQKEKAAQAVAQAAALETKLNEVSVP